MRILFLAESISLAHIGRPLELAFKAFQDGHQIFFACESEKLKIAHPEELPFATFPLRSINSQVFFHRIHNEGKFPYTFEELQEYLNEDLRLINEIKPDLIVSDFRLTATIAGELTNRKVAQIANAHWSPFSLCPFLPPPTAAIAKLGSFLFKLIRPLAFKVFPAPFNRLRKSLHLKPIKDFRTIYTAAGDYTLYADLPQKNMSIPAHHKWLGPIIWQPKVANNKKYITPSCKNIYITMGGSGNLESLFPIFEALKDLKTYYVISGIPKELKKVLLTRFSYLKNNSLITELLDPNTILPNSQITICHGGSGTVYQSLSHGVPVLCLPSHSDQQLVALYAKENGVGEYIYKKRLDSNEIKNLTLQILNASKYQQNAKQIAQEIKDSQTYENWLKFLKELDASNKDDTKTRRIFVKNRETGVSLALKQILKENIEQKKPSSEYSIQLATDSKTRRAAYHLAYQVYQEKGYTLTNEKQLLINAYDHDDDTAVLAVMHNNKVIGTATMVFNHNKHASPVETIFADEIQALRNRGEKIVEISRLAISSEHRNSAEVMLLLINHIAIYTDCIKQYSCLCIEVNPRHKTFYKAMLCFEEIGSERPSPFVKDAPAVLLYLPLNRYRQEFIRNLDRQNQKPTNRREKFLSSWFVDPEQEQNIANKLKEEYQPITDEQKIEFSLDSNKTFKTA